jgi:hypothetical protein
VFSAVIGLLTYAVGRTLPSIARLLKKLSMAGKRPAMKYHKYSTGVCSGLSPDSLIPRRTASVNSVTPI